jgi:hypothetical protein
MKGVGWIAIVLALLGVTYLVTKDLGALTGDRGGKAVLEPLQRAKETAGLADRTQRQLQEGLDKIDEGK